MQIPDEPLVLDADPVRLVQEEDWRRVREAGFDDHLTKPVAVDDLTRVLEQSRRTGRL